MSKKNIFDLSKTKKVAELLNNQNHLIFGDVLDIKSLFGTYSLIVSSVNFYVLNADEIMVECYLRLDLEDDQIDYQATRALIDLDNSTIDYSHTLKVIDSISSVTNDKDTVLKELTDYFNDKFTILRLTSRQLYQNMSVDKNLRQIDNFLRRNSEELFNYLNIEEKLDNMTSFEMIKEVVNEYYLDDLEHQVDIELKPYDDPEGDFEGKRLTILYQMREWVIGSIALGVDVKNLVSNMRHKIVNEMLTHDMKYIEKLTDEDLDEILQMINHQYHHVEIFKKFDFDIDAESTRYIQMILKDKLFSQRFDEYYKKFIEDKFYQVFLESARELGLIR